MLSQSNGRHPCRRHVIECCEEQEFITKDNYIASDCFITPPNKGDFYVVKNVIWEVVSVTHSFGSCNPGYIFLQKQRDLKNGIQEKN